MEESKKIYIGNLEYGVNEADLKKAIEDKGLTPSEVNVITDRESGRSKGFGFAEFATEEEAQKAIDALNGQDLNGRALNVSRARKMKPRREGGFGGGHRRDSFGGGGYGRGSRY